MPTACWQPMPSKARRWLNMLAHQAKNVAVLDDSTQYGKGLADQVDKSLKEGGSNIIGHDRQPIKPPTLKRFNELKAKNPEYVFWGGMDDTAATLVKQMQELGMSAKLVAADGACTDKFIELAGSSGGNMDLFASRAATVADGKRSAI